jgi:uncharacterized coiled-coil protein SlyX
VTQPELDRGELRRRIVELEQRAARERALLAELDEDAARRSAQIAKLEKRLRAKPKPLAHARSSVVGRLMLCVIFVPLAALIGATSGTLVSIPIVLATVMRDPKDEPGWALVVLYALAAVGAVSAAVHAARTIWREW